jgi:hypothetical protein
MTSSATVVALFGLVIAPRPPQGACSLKCPIAPATSIAQGAPPPNRLDRGRAAIEAPPCVSAAYRFREGRGGWISSGGSVEATGPSFARAFHQPLSAARDRTPCLRCPIAPAPANSRARRARARRSAPAVVNHRRLARRLTARVSLQRPRRVPFQRAPSLREFSLAPAVTGSLPRTVTLQWKRAAPDTPDGAPSAALRVDHQQGARGARGEEPPAVSSREGALSPPRSVQAALLVLQVVDITLPFWIGHAFVATLCVLR